MRLPRSVLSAFAAAAFTVIAGAAELSQSPAVHAALDRISFQSLRGHVSFLASDLLEGRATPSPGLDLAAEYIAAQFRRAGLEAAGDNGYFQTAKYLQFESDLQGAKVELESGGKRVMAATGDLKIQVTGPVSLTDVPVLKFAGDDLEKVARLKHADVENSVVAFHLARFGQGGYRTYSALRRLQPALIIVVGEGVSRQNRLQLVAADARDSEPAVVAIREGEFVDAIERAKPGSSNLRATVQLAAPKERMVTLKNVAAILRGSDPVLKDTYLLVTAHYDHLGLKMQADGDRIYNGANDDASGTASVIEIASALAVLDPKPKRSIVFVTVFGEELGLLGSQYYGRHPLVPLAKTIGDINLEHLGRTDANDGAKIASASFTGFDYSGLPAVFAKAGEQVGVKVYKDEKRSDSFFARSDNQALADLGIPAHTLCVAFEFSDYHEVGDEWSKIDYENMAKVDRMVALGLIVLANSDAIPRWNEDLEKVKRYAEAWRALHAEETR